MKKDRKTGVLYASFEYCSKTIKMHALKLGLVINNIKIVYKLQISFNLDLGQLRNLCVKLDLIGPDFHKIWPNEMCFF